MLRHSKDEELCKQLLMDQDSRKEEHIKFKRSIESKAKAFRRWRAREGANQLQMEDNSNIKILVSNQSYLFEHNTSFFQVALSLLFLKPF